MGKTYYRLDRVQTYTQVTQSLSNPGFATTNDKK